MPPRRSTRAASARLFDGSPEAGGPLAASPIPNAVASRGMSPGPAKFSSAYGSPPTFVPRRQNVARQRYSLSSALNHVINTVDDDNENDARERAEREAEELRRRFPSTSVAPEPVDPLPVVPQQSLRPNRREESLLRQVSMAPATPATPSTPDAPVLLPTVEPAAEPAQDADESGSGQAAADAPADNQTDSSVDLVSQPGRSRQKRPRPRPRPRQRQQPSEETDAAAPGNEAVETSTPEQQLLQQLQQQQQQPVPNNFAEEDSIFAEARISSPVLPSRTGVVSRTSSALQSLLHSARRLSGRRNDTADDDDEAIRQAYPHLNFIRPRSDVDSGPTTASTVKDNDLGTSTDAPAVLPVAARIQSRILTPGPGVRTRRVTTRHDRAQDSPVETTAARSSLGRRRQPQEQPQEQPEPESQPAAVVIETIPGQQAHDVYSLAQRAMTGFTKTLGWSLLLIVFGALVIQVYDMQTNMEVMPGLYEPNYVFQNRLRWYGTDLGRNLRQFLPFALVKPSAALRDGESDRIDELFQHHTNAIGRMHREQRLLADALQRVNRILPAVVHMDLDKHGQPTITQQFWHALKAEIQSDSDILTLARQSNGLDGISPHQLHSIHQQLEANGISDTRERLFNQVQHMTEVVLSTSWQPWLSENRKRVRAILGISGAASSETKTASSLTLDDLTDDEVALLASKMAASKTAREAVVSRKEFLQILQNSFSEHHADIRSQMADLEKHVLDVARAAATAAVQASSPTQDGPPANHTGAASSGSSGLSSGLSRKEITKLVDQLVRKGISDAQLEAMARSKIRADWLTNLVHQVNFFTRNAGATFNHHFSSPTYQPMLPSSWKRLFGRSGIAGAAGGIPGVGGAFDPSTGDQRAQDRPVPGSQRGSVVFESWEQDGDCWCAALGDNRVASTASPSSASTSSFSAASIAVKLGLRIVPQHLVVEHIHPGATLDPGSTPKDLEVWAQITDYTQQRSLQDWSLAQFPDTSERHPLFGWGFVKIGHFQFEQLPTKDSKSSGSSGGGSGSAQVFRLPPELESLDAVTDHVIVRALSNHGDADHTCFYRLRLYGQPRPDVVE